VHGFPLEDSTSNLNFNENLDLQNLNKLWYAMDNNKFTLKKFES
jgi:hypothetical protein